MTRDPAMRFEAAIVPFVLLLTACTTM